MITTNSEILYKKIFSLKDHGKEFDKFSIKPKNDFNYIHDSLGSNFRLTEIQSAIGRLQLKKLNNWINLRIQHSKILDIYLKDLKIIRIPKVPDEFIHSRYRYYCYIKKEFFKPGWNRSKIIKLIKESNFPAFSGSCSEIYLEKSIIQTSNIDQNQRLPIAKQLGETSLAFLIHPTITEQQMHSYANEIRRILKSAQK